MADWMSELKDKRKEGRRVKRDKWRGEENDITISAFRKGPT